MGTKTPLTIFVLPPCDTWEKEITEWRAAGHTVVINNSLEPDLIIGTAAWHLTDELRSLAGLAVKSAQMRRKKK